MHIKRRVYLHIVNVVQYLRKVGKQDYISEVVCKQLVRSITSIGANIIEAQAGSSRRDFTKFMNYSLKSANESKFWFALLRDSDIGNRKKNSELLDETVEISKILGASMMTLRGVQKK